MLGSTRVLISVACAGLVALAGIGSRALAATVSVAPADTSVIEGDTFTVRAEVDAVSDLKTFQLIYKYDPTRLQFLGATAGDVLTSAGMYFEATLPDFTAPADSVWYDAAVLSGTGSGPGILVFLKFKAIQVGDVLLDCQRADFRDSQNQQTLPPCFDGIVHVLPGPTPTRSMTLGRLKTLYR